MGSSKWKAGGAGETVRYSEVSTRLGPTLVAWTARGVCEVAFEDRWAGLATMLAARLPRADLIKVEPGPWVNVVEQFVEGRTGLELRLDVVATAFQAKVWQSLLQIPHGETRTYSDIAVAIGHPAATRAVATAVGANPVAVVIPCHRVVRKDGSLGGFRWGVSRKRDLLYQERSVDSA
jgi:AraC family transcriptional regulator, regulatory protein of adaptative response / methylated-DNA-[protein]-cysteine methyltransferase